MAFHRIHITDEIIASMQADRDRGMSIARIAHKYGYSEGVVFSRTVVRECLDADIDIKARVMPKDFAEQWNAARCRLWGMLPEWYGEWNTVRHQILGEIKKAKGL